MRRILLFLGTVLLGIVLFGVLVSGVGWEAIWRSLRSFSFEHAVWVFLLTGAFLGAGVLRWQGILRSQKIYIPSRKLWSMYLGGFSLFFFMPIIPFANEFFRASILKKEHDVAFRKGMASVVVDRILEVTSNLFIVIIGATIFLFLAQSAHYAVQIGALLIFIGIWVTLLFLLYLRIFQKKSIIRIFWRGEKRVTEAEAEVFRFFRLKNPAFWEGMIFSLLRSGVGLARAWVLIFFLGKGFLPLAGFAALALYYLGIIVPIPASLGPHDAFQAIGFEALSMGAGAGAAFALIIRVAEVLFAILGLFVVFHFGWSILHRAILHKEEGFIKLWSR